MFITLLKNNKYLVNVTDLMEYNYKYNTKYNFNWVIEQFPVYPTPKYKSDVDEILEIIFQSNA